MDFLSEPRHGLISSSKSKFRDQDQRFWLDRTPGNETLICPGTRKPALQKISSISSFQLLKLVISKCFVFPFEVLSYMFYHTNIDERIEGADNFRAWKYRISLVLEENELDSYISGR